MNRRDKSRRFNVNPKGRYGSVQFSTRGKLSRSRWASRRATPIVSSPAHRALGKASLRRLNQRQEKETLSPRDLLRGKRPSLPLKRNPRALGHEFVLVANVKAGDPGTEYGIDAVTPIGWKLRRAKNTRRREYGYQLPDDLLNSPAFVAFVGDALEIPLAETLTQARAKLRSLLPQNHKDYKPYSGGPAYRIMKANPARKTPQQVFEHIAGKPLVEIARQAGMLGYHVFVDGMYDADITPSKTSLEALRKAKRAYPPIWKVSSERDSSGGQNIYSYRTSDLKRNPAPRADKIRAAARRFQAFTGHTASAGEQVHFPDNPGVGLAIGPLLGVMYSTIRDGKRENYIHRFRSQSRPLLATSHDGSTLYLLGGAYRFTARGIVDK